MRFDAWFWKSRIGSVLFEVGDIFWIEPRMYHYSLGTKVLFVDLGVDVCVKL